jgi:hypothetical protein
MKLTTALPGVLVLAAMASTGYAQNPAMSGKWVLNHDKSQGPQAATEVLTYEVKGDEEHYIVDEVEKDGRKFNTEYTAKLDSKEYPNKNLVTGQVNYVSIRQMFPRVEELTNIRHVKGPDGKEVSEVSGHYIRILSADGKEYTSVLTNAKGDVTSVRVFEKQGEGSEASSTSSGSGAQR